MSPEDKEYFQDQDLDNLRVHEPSYETIAKVLQKCGGLKPAIKTVAQLLASEPPHNGEDYVNIFLDCSTITQGSER